MRNLLKAGMLLLTAIVISFILAPSAFASQATSYTYTMDDKGDWTRTRDAYLPDNTITNLGLNAPDDIFIDKQNMMFIADSANARIVKYSIDTATVEGILTYTEMKNPRGVFVTKKGDIYVADPSAKMVFAFDKDFNFLQSFGRPQSPSYGDTKYEPLRVSVDNGGNLYIISEGVYNGVIQLAPTGDFLGYFSVNKTKLSFIQSLQKAIFTRAQLDNLVPFVPNTFSNIFIDDDNIVSELVENGTLFVKDIAKPNQSVLGTLYNTNSDSTMFSRWINDGLVTNIFNDRDDYPWTEPRPFINNTIKDLESNKKYIKVLSNTLKKNGIKTK
jgi:hypothetical protein